MSTSLQPFLLQETDTVKTTNFVSTLLTMADSIEELKKMALDSYGHDPKLWALDNAAQGLRSIAGQYLTRKTKRELDPNFQVTSGG